MELDTFLVNLAYLIYVVALLFRAVLTIRVVLLVSSVAFLLYGLVADIPSVVLWNLAFGLVGTWQIVRIVRERRQIEMTDVERAVHRDVCSSLAPHDFLYLWQLGSTRHLGRECVIEQGGRVRDLVLILDGEMEVEIDGAVVAQLTRHHFVGEMSLLSGKPATATVRSTGQTVVRRWDQEHLRGLERSRPDLASALWRLLGEDLAVKVNR